MRTPQANRSRSTLLLVLSSVTMLLLGGCDSSRGRGGGGRIDQQKDSGSSKDTGFAVDAGQVARDTGNNPPPGSDGGNNPPPGSDAGNNPPPGRDGGPQDMGPPPMGRPVGSSCTTGAECATGACFTGSQPWWDEAFTGGYCTQTGCSQASPCPAGSECFSVDQQMNTACLKNCMTGPECGRTGYDCFDPGACLPGANTPPPPPPPGGGSTVGGPCMTAMDCRDQGADCIPETGPNGPTGWVGGYCFIPNCDQQNPCPNGSDCYTVDQQGATACLRTCTGPGTCGRTGYACLDNNVNACIPACTATSCDPGEVCDMTSGLCVNQPCTAGSCQAPLVCDPGSGQCVVDVGTPPPGPVPNCSASAPAWQCTGGESFCGQVVPFEPDMGPGYWDYPINGETATNEYRSYIRRDVMMLVKYASYMVDCLGAGWTNFGNQQPLGLGDMSEQNGAIPGTSVGQPGHPQGTHTNGRDMDIAYYQLAAPDNRLRSVCPHITGGQDQYHCTSAPNDLDIWRTALFLGLIHQSPQLRVIGVDGQIGPLIDSAITQLCAGGWFNTSACSANGYAITYETTDMGRGWFRFHHHHFHISLSDQNGNATIPNYSGPNACLVPDCRPAEHDHRPLRSLGTPKKMPLENVTIFGRRP